MQIVLSPSTDMTLLEWYSASSSAQEKLQCCNLVAAQQNDQSVWCLRSYCVPHLTPYEEPYQPERHVEECGEAPQSLVST